VFKAWMYSDSLPLPVLCGLFHSALVLYGCAGRPGGVLCVSLYDAPEELFLSACDYFVALPMSRMAGMLVVCLTSGY